MHSSYLFRTAGILALLSAFIVGGTSCGKKRNTPDVSHIEVEAEVQRFDRQLFALDTNNIDIALQGLIDSVPFTEFFIDFILGYRVVASDSTVSREEIVRGYITHPEVRALYDTVQQHFGNLDQLEEDLHVAFQYFKYYFPELDPPEVYTMISEYHTALLLPPEEEAIVVSLDLFMGPDYEIYRYHPLNLPAYISRTLTLNQLAARIVEAMVDDLVGESKHGRLLDVMVNEGKKLYLIDMLLPNTPDSVKWGYTSGQTEWVKDNEYQMWVYLLDENLLYEDNLNRFRKLVDYSPTSPGMPPESPGRTANWLGLQIVKAYMSRFPETTIRELLSIDDAQEILTRSRYKPD